MRRLSQSVFAGAAAALLAMSLTAQPAQAQRPVPSFVTFDAYLNSVAGANYATPAAKNMRDYVLDLYNGVRVSHSYQFDGAYFDCADAMSQPTVRDLGLKKLATPPDAGATGADNNAKGTTSPLRLGLTDAFGNAVSCKAGTIPMRRLNLDQMTKFPSVQAYLGKTPDGVVSDGASLLANPHRYAARRQYLTNYGGSSWINLWNPSGEFTLSQQWFGTGSGTTTQTVEGGWVHYPGKFGNNAVLFIFSTPDATPTVATTWSAPASSRPTATGIWAAPGAPTAHPAAPSTASSSSGSTSTATGGCISRDPAPSTPLATTRAPCSIVER